MVLGLNNDSMLVNFNSNLWKNSKKLNIYMQRMATGLRINSAQDDVANFGLSERMKANLNAKSILTDNASTGVSALKTLDGDLEQVSNLLQRMRVLTLQGMNGVYSTSEKSMLMDEINQLGSEIKRITDASSFADKKMLSNNATQADPMKIFVNDDNTESYIDLSSVSQNMLFADVLSGNKDVYMLNMAPGQTSYVEFNNKIYQLKNTSTTNKNLIYGYEENLGDENNSISFVQDSEGVTKSFIAEYDNTQVQLGNGERYLTLTGGQTSLFSVGSNVFSLTNSSGSSQTAVFTTSGTSLNMVSGQDVSGNYQYSTSGYTQANGSETAISLNGSQQKYISYGGKIYSLTNNSASQETFIYNNTGNLNPLSGNVSSSWVGDISNPTTLNASNKFLKLSAGQELFYDNAGTVYSLKNNTAQAQMVVLDAANNVVNSTASVSQTALSTITGSTGMANPYSIDAVAGQKYFIKSNDDSKIYELTANGTGKLLIDFNGTNISSIGGVGATSNVTNAPRFENVTPDGSNKFTIDLSPNAQESITIGSEVYKISNTGGTKNNITFTYDSVNKLVTIDTPDTDITVDGYQGDLASKTALGANDYYIPTLASGQSTYIKTGSDIFKVTNSSGSSTNSIFSYNSGAHTLTSADPGFGASLLTQAGFTNATASDRDLRLNAGQTKFVQFGNDTFEIKNNSASNQSLMFSYSAGNLNINDAEIASYLSITKRTVDTGQTNLAFGDVYTTFNAGETKYFDVGNKYFKVDNTSGTRTALFRPAGNTLAQQVGTGVNNTFMGNEAFETLSNASEYYISMNAGAEQYIKVGSYAYKMNNVTGSGKTDVFSQSGSNLISQNNSITDLNIPLENQDDFSQLMPIVDWAIGVVSDKRSLVGTKINNLNNTITVNSTNKLALSSANSVLRDSDIAKENAEYTKESILRNFSTSLFKQAKGLNGELALTLLVG